MPGLTNETAGAATAAAVQDVFDLTNAELTLQEVGGAITSTAAEQNVYVNDNPLGAYIPVSFLINVDNMAAGGDQITLREYYRITPGAGWELLDVQALTGVDGGLAGGRTLVSIDLRPTRFGCRITLQRTGGADYVFPWAVHIEN